MEDKVSPKHNKEYPSWHSGLTIFWREKKNTKDWCALHQYTQYDPLYADTEILAG